MKKFKLYGFSSPARISPSFLVPIFECEGQFYAQHIDDKDTIVGFEKVYLDSINSIQSGKEDFFEIGNDAIFGVTDRSSEVTYNTKIKLKHYLRSKIVEYIDSPFFYKEVSDFCSVTLPEFYGCGNNNDFLARQVVSNIIPEFVNEHQVRIHKLSTNRKSSSYELQLSELFSKFEKRKFALTSNHKSLYCTYKYFIDFAIKKHKRLSTNASFYNSLDSASRIISHIDKSNEIDAYDIRESLVYILNHSLTRNKKEKHDNLKVKCTKEKRKFYNKQLFKFESDEWNAVNIEQLSFIIFIISRFTQEALKKQQEEVNLKHITKT